MAAASIGSRVHHYPTATNDDNVIHEQRYLMSELESLGYSTIQLNEFNNNEELRNLVYGIKKQSESPSSSSKNIVTKNQYIEELRSLGIRIKTAEHGSEIRVGGQQELADVVRIVKYSLYNAYKTFIAELINMTQKTKRIKHSININNKGIAIFHQRQCTSKVTRSNVSTNMSDLSARPCI